MAFRRMRTGLSGGDESRFSGNAAAAGLDGHVVASRLLPQASPHGGLPWPEGVSPPPSIIPSPGAPPPTANATQTTNVGYGTTYTLAAGTYLYATQMLSQLLSDNGVGGTLVNQGTIWDDSVIFTHGVRVAVDVSVIDNRGLIVVILDPHSPNTQTGQQDMRAVISEKIVNSGQIFALASNGDATAIFMGNNSGESLTNSGLIAARSEIGVAKGVQINSWLVNAAGGRILAEGAEAVAVYFKNGVVPYLPAPGGNGYVSMDLINNAGLIEAVSLDPTIGSVAIVLAHSGPLPGGTADFRDIAIVVNSGTIRGDYSIICDPYAVSTTVARPPEIIRNLAGGLIEGIMLLDRGEDVIENAGIIRGYVSMGESADRVDTSIGIIEGIVDLGWGNDQYLGSAGVDLAAGDNGDDVLQGNGGNDLLSGGGNNDVLIGNAGNDGLFGDHGNDRIVTQSGDFVWGGFGDDRIELGDYTFEFVSGNEGFDTLVLPDGARLLDLSLALAEGALDGLERIVLGGGKELVVRAADVPLISGGGHALWLDGGATDRVDLVGAWVAGAIATLEGVSYRRYDLDGQSVYVATAATASVQAAAPAGAAGLDPFAGGELAPVPGEESGMTAQPLDTFFYGYRLTESVACNPEELWWNEGIEPVIKLFDNTFTVALTNYGTIASVSGFNYPQTRAVQGRIGGGTVFNYGTLAAINEWDDGLPKTPFDEDYFGFINATHQLATIVNHGEMIADSVHGKATAALFPGSLTNEGLIFARSEKGYAIGVDEPGILVNRGTISAEGGLEAVGVHYRGDHGSNEGRIEAAMTGAAGESIGVRIWMFGFDPQSLYTYSNAGEIVADIALQFSLSEQLGFNRFNLTNTGTMVGRLELGRGGDRVDNRGTIAGAVLLNDGDDLFDGSSGIQSGLIDGGLGNDTLTGGAGADILKGGLGADILDGKGGADLFLYQAAADSTAASMDRIRAFQSGLDRIDLVALAPSSVSWAEAADADGLYSLVSIATAGGTMTIRVDGHVAMSDFIIAPPLNLVGTAGGDTLTGGAGDDMLDGAGGADTLSGGRGNDIYIVDNASDLIHELAGEGSDLIYTSVSYALGTGEEVEALSTRVHGGTEAIYLIGNGFAQTIVGNAGANLIDGRGGADVMAGLAGDDSYVVDNALDQILEGIGQGNDSIITSVSYVLSSNQEIETLTTQTHAGTDDLFLTGNQYNNTLIGNAGDNIINGVGGADVMYGLDGDDTYAIDDLGDLVIDLENQGNDLVLTYLSHTLSNGNQIETLSTVFHQGTDAINLGGNDYNNTLIGNYGANYLNGNGGADVMIGLNGNDTYVADNAADLVQEVAGGGADLLYSFVSYTLAAGQEVETISTAVQGGTTTINLTGNEFAQTIVGNAGANLIDGKGGSDVLYGLGGADTFAFTTALGAGNVDTLADFAAGTDKIGLDDAIFTAIGATLNASAFVIGTAAGDADDRIVYNSTTGALFYDADGSGAGAAVQFATLAPGLALTAGDFAVI
ncbi:MAG TPA: calcium-binding protein [Allosphingosinicella sp.]|nr:calcium-binding protein [Allosphingosinicella sp.]